MTTTEPTATQQTPSAHPNDVRSGGHIRSFATRQGHLSDAQRRAIEQLLPRHGVPYVAQPTDLRALFGDTAAPLVLEIGCGMGETTAHIASVMPQTNFVGCEVYPAGVGALLTRIEQQQLRNLKVINHDAVEVVRDMIAPQSLDGAHVFFPDPWHKKKHHKRRLLQAPFVQLLASRLKPGGYIHCATDWQEYAEQMLAVLSAEAQLQNTAADYADKPSYRPLTKFEARGLRLGHGVWDLVFRRRPL